MLPSFARICLLLVLLGGGCFRISGAQEIRPFKTVFHPVISQQKIDDAYLTTLRIDIPEGYYLYAQKTGPELPASAAATVTKSPAPEKTDPYFGNVRIYDHEHPAVFTIRQPNAQDHYLLRAQGCQENIICYPPEEWLVSVAAGGPVENRLSQKNTATIPGVAGPRDKNFLGTRKRPDTIVSPNPKAAQKLLPARTATVAASSSAPTISAHREPATVTARLNRNYWLTLPWLVLLGIGVSFTACIYPLIPIVTSLVVGSDTSRRRGYALIAVYILAMAAAMAMLGAIFGHFQINIQIILQQPLFVITVAAFFALLSVSMFGLFTLRVPAFWGGTIDRILRRQSSGSFTGAAIMGALSMLVVSPCATPVLTALLLYTTQTTPIMGALALFCFGLGSGLPLFLFAGVLRRFMPRAGNWMIAIRYVFAFLLLAVAVWLSGRILPPFSALILWVLYAFALAFFVAKKTHIFGHGLFRRALCGVAVITGFALMFQAFDQKYRTAPDEQYKTRFQRIDDVETLSGVIAQSRQAVIVDFTAEWCIACRIQEKEIWRNPRFISALQDYRLVKVDVTKFTSEHRTLFRTLDIIGPPAMLFYPASGELESPAKTVVGALSPDTFASLLQSHVSGG